MGAPAPGQVCGAGSPPPPGWRLEASVGEPRARARPRDVAAGSSLPGLSLFVCKTGFSGRCPLLSPVPAPGIFESAKP